MADWIIKDAPGAPQKSSFSENPIVRGIGQFGIGAAEGLAGLAGLPGSAVGALQQSVFPKLNKLAGTNEAMPENPLPTSQGLMTGLQKYIPESYQQPEGIIESFSRNLGGTVPGAAIGALTGGAGLPLAASSLGSAAGQTAAQELGFGSTGQTVGSLAGGIGGSLLAGAKIPTVRSTKKIEDTLARAAVKPNSRSSATGISEAFKAVEEQLATETSKKTATKIKHALGTINKHLINGEINPVRAMDIRKSLYKLGNELPKDVAAQYIQPLTKGINNFFAVYAAENPTFWKHLNARDRLTELGNMNLWTQNFVDKLNLGKLPGGELAAYIANKTIGGGERFARGLITNSPARKYYFDAVMAAAQEAPVPFIKSLTKVAELMPTEETEAPETGGWIIK